MLALFSNSASGVAVVPGQADSGYDAALYTALSAAPVLLLDGRGKGTSEHAGFSQLAAAGKSGRRECMQRCLLTPQRSQRSWLSYTSACVQDVNSSKSVLKLPPSNYSQY